MTAKKAARPPAPSATAKSIKRAGFITLTPRFGHNKAQKMRKAFGAVSGQRVKTWLTDPFELVLIETK
ncbi:hypothetical protein GCM10007879_17000 [Maritalea porphyrae]|uniref:Uncharacterized protein n=1 Tax=Maritalea porphyrae TaxID=880732 RepID=A0ABQ5USU4_9HYPH|nr:hypothetical protein GCM10007879_17000 [Maritalea porphyrae]